MNWVVYQEPCGYQSEGYYAYGADTWCGRRLCRGLEQNSQGWCEASLRIYVVSLSSPNATPVVRVFGLRVCIVSRLMRHIFQRPQSIILKLGGVKHYFILWDDERGSAFSAAGMSHELWDNNIYASYEDLTVRTTVSKYQRRSLMLWSHMNRLRNGYPNKSGS